METMLYIFTKEVSLLLELIKKVLIDWVGKGLFQAKGDQVDKKVIWDFFLKIIVVYDSYHKSHVHIATS